MAAPTVVSVSPANAEGNVYLNKRIVVTFSEAIDSDSINDNTVRLTHSPTNSRVWFAWSLSDDGTVLTITPDNQLDAEETYVLTLIGSSDGFAFYLYSETTDALATTERVTFTTGNDIEAYSGEKTDLTSQREGDLVLPADLQVVPGERLEITETSPQHHSCGLSQSLSSITATFSADLSGDLLEDDWMEVTVYPLFGYTEYLAQPSGETYVFSINDPINPSGEYYSFDSPTGEVSITGDQLAWTRDTGDENNIFPMNCEVEVLIGSDVQDKWGNTLGETRRFVFTVESTPMFDSVRGIERELATIPEEVDRDLIYALIWKYSIMAWQKLNSTNPPTKAYHYIRMFVHNSVCLDILDNAELPKTIFAGQDKALGDFRVSFNANAVGKVGLKYKRLQDDLKKAEIALMGMRNKARVATRGSTFDRPHWKNRTWRSGQTYNTDNYPGRPKTETMPVSNSADSRGQELPGEGDSWD